MASSRQVPVNPEYWTYGSDPSRDYGEGEMANYLTDRISGRDFTSEDVSPFLTIYNDQASFNDALNLSVVPYTADATRFPVFTGEGPTLAQKPYIKYIGSHIYGSDFLQTPVNIQDKNVGLYDIRAGLDCVVPNYGSVGVCAVFWVKGSDNKCAGLIAEDVILRDPNGYGTVGSAAGFFSEGGVDSLINCAVRGTLTTIGEGQTSVGLYMLTTGAYTFNFNCITITSVVAVGILIIDYTGAGTVDTYLNNVLIENSAMGYFGYNLGTSTYNFYEDGYSGNVGISFEADGVTPSSGAAVIDSGSTLVGFDDDIFGTTRPQGTAWDIGAVERESASTQKYTDVSESESNALEAFYTATDGDNWVNKTGWDGALAANCFGITVVGGHVTKMEFPENDLNGTVTNTIMGEFAYLTLFDGSTNTNFNYDVTTTEVQSSLTKLNLENSDSEITGNLSNLHENIIELKLGNTNSLLEGNVSSLPNTIIHLECQDTNSVIIGVLSDLPNNLITINLNNTSSELTGELNDLSTTIQNLRLSNTSSDITGNLSHLPSSIKTLDLSITNSEIIGDLSNVPSGMISLILSQSDSELLGDLSYLSSSLTTLKLSQTSSLITGTLDDLPAGFLYLHLNNTNSIISGGESAMTCNGILELYLNYLSLSTENIDSILNRLYADRLIFNGVSRSLNISGTNDSPTGIVQTCVTPQTPAEKAYTLINDQNTEGFGVWSISYSIKPVFGTGVTSNILATQATLTIPVSIPNGSNLTITYKNTTTDATIDTDTISGEGDSSIDWENLIDGNSYSWKATTIYDEITYSSDSYTFSIPKDKPEYSLVSPINRSNVSNVTIYLNVYVYDPKDRELTVYFYLNNVLIDTKENVTSGRIVFTLLDVLLHGDYNWKVILDNGESQTESSLFYFKAVPSSMPPPFIRTQNRPYYGKQEGGRKHDK